MRWIVTAFLVSFMSLAWAAPEPQAKSKSSGEGVWPRDFNLRGSQKVTVFQPQVESLSQNILKAMSAFKITKDKKDYYGSFNFSAKALINKESGVVALSDVIVTDVQLPSGPLDKKTLQSEIQAAFAGKESKVPYEAIRKNMEVQIAEEDRPAPVIKNDVPNFIFTMRPGILIMVAGDPKWVESQGAKEVKRIINTSALILHQDNDPYYIWALGKWFSSPQLTGPYAAAKEPSSKFVYIKDQLIKDKKIDPISGKTQDGKDIYPPNLNPDIFISTRPAELLQSEGEPKFSSVANTALLYVSNSPNSIFMDSQSQNFYVLVTGRWFMTKSLKSGPWSYVPGKSLPADFAKIPVTSPVAEVLVSVPGSPQAREAQIVSAIPQMAKVPKDLKPKNIQCDGSQKWTDITGTSLKYAQNCNTPIIMVNSKQYYAVQDGVWFVAQSGTGPWSVAVAVPSEIYKMPSSSPLYYVTYVHVYGSDDQYVTVGYTPGYHGTFVSADGTIVYGTGYLYPYYASGTAWYPAPATYGFGVGYGWGYSDGFYMGFAMGGMMYPWGWGSCCWGGYYVNVNVTNIYHNWGKTTIVTGPGGGFNVNTIGDTKFARVHGSNEIYAGKDGQIYRRNPDGQWQHYQGPGAWEDVNRNKTGSLENQRQARGAEPAARPAQSGMAEQRMPEQRAPASQPQYLHGGSGARAGGGFRGGGGGFRR